ncbi:MAG: hypothetical protein A2163_00790 [Actinobacteria bacterium RBG_13_35_12]|nr:MAG: hypothetical protein A2163_00790 [Actinobacteria bacterium RBG_13_35_12]
MPDIESLKKLSLNGFKHLIKITKGKIVMSVCKSGRKIKLNEHKKTLFCVGQKTPSKQYEKEYDRIFNKKQDGEKQI